MTPNLDATTDLMLAIHHAKDRELKLTHARRLVELRWERGDFPEIALLDDLTREALALRLVKERK